MRAQNRSVFGQTIEDPAHVFAAFDRDGSGKLSPDELKNALRRLGLGLSEQQLSELRESIDEDGDGEVDYAELLDFLAGEHEMTSTGASVAIHLETAADDPDDGGVQSRNQQSETMEEREEHYKARLADQKKQVEEASKALAAEQAARRAAEAEVLQAEKAAKARFDALLVADMKAALESALAAELVSRQGQSADSAIEQYVASLAVARSRVAGSSPDEHRRHDAATQIQAFYRGRRAREEVYRFLIEKEERRRQNWEEQWKQAQQMRRHAEQLFQEGEEKLLQARRFAASAERDRVASTNDDASLQKWLASRSRPASSARPNPSGLSFLHDSYDGDGGGATGQANVRSKKTKATASPANLNRLSQTHLEKAEKLRQAKADRDQKNAQEEAGQCIDWKLMGLFNSIDSTSSGTLQMTGIGILCTQLGLTMDEDSLIRAMASMDDDKDGRVNLLEFNQWFTKATKARARRSDGRQSHTLRDAGSNRRGQHAIQSPSPGSLAPRPVRNQLPVGDRLHAWGEKRRDDRIAKQSSWMEARKSRQPHINPKSRKLAEPRTRDNLFDRFDTWQKTKEEKIAQKVKQQEEDEVKDLRDKPDISVGLSQRVQLQLTGDVADRLSTGDRTSTQLFEELSKPKAVAVHNQDVYWAKTEPAPKVEHKFASTIRNELGSDPTKPTRSSDARKTTLAHSWTSVDDATFGEVFLQHSIDFRKHTPSPQRKDASGTSMPHTDRLSQHSLNAVAER
jgi:Ca2+-binding EF-hand superfamily protein